MTPANQQSLAQHSLGKLHEKISRIKFCMLTTINAQGQLVSRPMTEQSLDMDGTLWFFTTDTGEIARDLAARPNVNLSFAEPTDSLYISIAADAQLIKDREKSQQLWNPAVAVWYPQGLDDPHLFLLKCNIQLVEYWDSGSNKMHQIFPMAKAALTGERPGDALRNSGDHGKLKF